MKSGHTDVTPAQVARLLRALASLVEKSSHQEIAALLRGQATLSEMRHNKGESRSQPDLMPYAPPDLSELSNKLHSLDSRDDGFSLLSSMSLTRRELESLGRLVGIPVLKTDNMERLAQKIVESSIGSRLSSEAIRGERAKPAKQED